MQRLLLDQLQSWKASPVRKPLILKGLRQVGKTWLLKEFGRTAYENVAYFNFEENPEYKEFFAHTKDVRRILPNLAMASAQTIEPERTLLIFDEIQEAPDALNALKYFHETANEYHVACAGSLLGIALARPSSFPVGQVDFLQVRPLTFTEFLLASGKQNLVDYLAGIDTLAPIPDAFFQPLYEQLKMYYVTGGMPEAVRNWTEFHDVRLVEETLQNILDAYERDFAKHPDRTTFPKLNLVWNSLPAQLAKENKRFLYNVVKKGARAREYEDALQWLVNAQLICKVPRITKPGLPISAYDDLGAFKIYAADVGLLRRMSHLSPTIFADGSRLFREFKGALTENYVLEALTNQFEVPPRYWSRLNPSYEVDFILQRENDIFPIEVKSEDNVHGTSLRKYAETFPEQTKLRLRFSLANLHLDGDLLNLPLFMIDQADRLIELALHPSAGDTSEYCRG